MGRRLFIVRDTTIRGIQEVLEDLCSPHEPHAGIDSASCHGVGDAAGPQGSIGADVYSRIASATHVLALMDLPNANVGFEIGYALAQRKPVALAHVRKDRPGWASIHPFADVFLPRTHDIDTLLAVACGDSWIEVPALSGGLDTVVLCPDDGVGKAARGWLRRSRPEWRLVEPPPLPELLRALEGARRVVWVVTPTDGERHGPSNAANAVVAGFA